MEAPTVRSSRGWKAMVVMASCYRPQAAWHKPLFGAVAKRIQGKSTACCGPKQLLSSARKLWGPRTCKGRPGSGGRLNSDSRGVALALKVMRKWHRDHRCPAFSSSVLMSSQRQVKVDSGLNSHGVRRGTKNMALWIRGLNNYQNHGPMFPMLLCLAVDEGPVLSRGPLPPSVTSLCTASCFKPFAAFCRGGVCRRTPLSATNLCRKMAVQACYKPNLAKPLPYCVFHRHSPPSQEARASYIAFNLQIHTKRCHSGVRFWFCRMIFTIKMGSGVGGTSANRHPEECKLLHSHSPRPYTMV